MRTRRKMVTIYTLELEGKSEARMLARILDRAGDVLTLEIDEMDFLEEVVHSLRLEVGDEE